MVFEPEDHYGNYRPASPREDGSFTLPEIAPARYQVRVSGLAGSYLKSMRYGEIESKDHVIEVGAQEALLELTLSAKAARVAGRVDPSGQYAAQLFLVGKPPGSREELSRTTILDQTGAFSLNGIAPGDYMLFASENLPEGAGLIPEFLAEIWGKGAAVHLDEGDVKNLEVPLLPKSVTSPILGKLGID